MVEENLLDIERIKKNAEILISNHLYSQASELLKECLKIKEEDPEIISMLAIIAIIENQLEDAKTLLIKGLTYDRKN